jgi:hypothetical protein
MVHGVGHEVVQLGNPCHHRRQGGRDAGIVVVGEMRFAVDGSSGAGERRNALLTCPASPENSMTVLVRGDGVTAEALRGKPIFDLGDVG